MVKLVIIALDEELLLRFGSRVIVWSDSSVAHHSSADEMSNSGVTDTRRLLPERDFPQSAYSQRGNYPAALVKSCLVVFVGGEQSVNSRLWDLGRG